MTEFNISRYPESGVTVEGSVHGLVAYATRGCFPLDFC